MSYAYTAYWWLSHELQPRRSPVTMFPESRPTGSLPANPQCGRLGDAPPEPEPGSQLWPGGQHDAGRYLIVLKEPWREVYLPGSVPSPGDSYSLHARAVICCWPADDGAPSGDIMLRMAR